MGQESLPSEEWVQLEKYLRDTPQDDKTNVLPPGRWMPKGYVKAGGCSGLEKIEDYFSKFTDWQDPDLVTKIVSDFKIFSEKRFLNRMMNLTRMIPMHSPIIEDLRQLGLLDFEEDRLICLLKANSRN